MDLRAKATRRDFLGHGKEPLVWRNLFFPTEVLNALGVRSLTLETYAALFARSQHKVKKAFDKAACKGFSGETCSFLRVLEGVQLPAPAFGVSTSQPCQQGERIFRDPGAHLRRERPSSFRCRLRRSARPKGISPLNISPRSWSVRCG